jgi:hypothetical protein
MDIHSAEGLLHLTRSLSRIVAEGRGNLIAMKALFGLISSPILHLELFLKPMSPQDKGRRLQGNPGIVSLKVPKCEIFDPFFFTPINTIWVGDLRTGEKKKF